jgi:hypothetical protein
VTGSVPTTDPPEAVLPPEALLEYVLYEPRDGPLDAAERGDPVRASRRAFVDEARSVCVSPRRTFVDSARREALDPEPGGTTAPTLLVQFREAAVDITLSSDELLESLILIYSIEGWDGIRQVSAALDAELQQRLGPPAPDTERHGTPEPDADLYDNRASAWALDPRNQSTDQSGVPQVLSEEDIREAEEERERWRQGKAAFDAARDLLGLAVVNALGRIERLATDLCIVQLNRMRNLAAEIWTRYGVEKVITLTEQSHLPPQPKLVHRYKFVLGQEDEKNKLNEAVKVLLGSLEELQKLEQHYQNLWSAQGGAGTRSWPRPSLEEAFPQIRGAQASFVNILAEQCRAHPIVSALMGTLKPGFDDDALAQRVGFFLETVIGAAEKFVPPQSRVGELTRDDWTFALDEGPEDWLVREASFDESSLDPLTYEPLLTELLADKRSVLDAFEYVVLQNYLDALAVAREMRQAKAAAKAEADLFLTLAQFALNVAAIFQPTLRPLTLAVDSALAVGGALAAIRAAAELEPGFLAEVQERLVAVSKGATIADLSELGQVVAAAPSSADVALLLLQAGVSLRATAATLRVLPTRRLAFLESLELVLSVT